MLLRVHVVPFSCESMLPTESRVVTSENSPYRLHIYKFTISLRCFYVFFFFDFFSGILIVVL